MLLILNYPVLYLIWIEIKILCGWMNSEIEKCFRGKRKLYKPNLSKFQLGLGVANSGEPSGEVNKHHTQG